MNRKESLEKLSSFFPVGGSKEKLSNYLLQLEKTTLEDSDIEAGVDDLIETRDASHFPAYAIVVLYCQKAKHARMMRDARYREAETPAWLRDPRVGDGVCFCTHGLGMHGPPEGGYGEPMLTGNCRRCACPEYR